MEEFLTPSQQGSRLAKALGFNFSELDNQAQSVLSLLQGYELNPDNVKPLDFTLSVGGNDVLAEGGLCVFSGKVKQGKSTAMAIVVGTLLGGRNFGAIKPKKNYNRVLWIDTEQADASYKKRMQTLWGVAGFGEFTTQSAYEHQVYTLALKHIESEEIENEKGEVYIKPDEVIRRELITTAVEVIQPDIVVIDQIMDCIQDDEKNNAPSVPLKWWEGLVKLCKLVIVSIHSNKGDGDLPEKVGYLLGKKATERFDMSKNEENGFITMKHIFSKDSENSPSIEIRFNDSGEPTPVFSPNGSVADRVEQLFAEVESYTSWQDIRKAYKNLTGESGEKANKFISDAIKSGKIAFDRKATTFKLSR